MPSIDFVEESEPGIDFQPDSIDFREDTPLDFQPEEAPVESAALSDAEVYQRTGYDSRTTPEKVKEFFTAPIRDLWNTITHPVSSTAKLAENVATVAAGEPRQIIIPGTRQALGLEGTPPIQIPQIPAQEGLGAKLGAGAINAGINFANFFLTPDGFASLGLAGTPTALQKTAAVAFGAQMATDAPERYKAAIDAAQQGDWQKFAMEATSFAGEAGLGAHLIKTGTIAPEQIRITEIQKPKSIIETKAAEVGPATELAVKGTDEFRVQLEPEAREIAEQPVEAGKVSVESPGPGAASPLEFEEAKALNFSEKQFLPDFLERDKERAVFSQPFGIGKWLSKVPVLGRLLDPNVKSNTYEQQGLNAYFAARNGFGPAQASYIGSRYGAEIRNAFKANESGDLNVGRTSEGQSLKISDVFEELQRNRNAYELTPEQRRVWDEVLDPLLKEKNELMKKYDLAQTEDANGDVLGHFHRVVTEFPKGKEPTITRTGQAVGAKVPAQRGRVFRRSEREGWEHGYKYELDPVKRLVSDIERTYKAIADKRLIEDPVFEGKTKTEFESQLREMFSEELASGEISEKSFQNILDNKMAQGRVYQPGYSGTIFEPQTAKLLNDALQSGDSQLRKIIATGNDFAKALVLGFDVGVGQLQLLPTFFRNPSVWAKANWESLKAIVKPDSFGEFVAKHEEAAKELAQAGSSIGQLQEYLSGLKPGQAITRIPVVGTVAKAFGRQFQTALDVAKIQLWEAWRQVTPANERLSVIRTIESQLNMGRMESIGISGRQALTERVLLLAPSYYRGAVNYIAAMTESGVSGKIARQGLTAFVGGGLALYYAVGKGLGMDDDELKKRLNPSRPDFMQWVGEGANGRKINFGIGGIHRSLLRLAGNMVKTSVEHPGNWATLSTEKNPLTRWLRGHGALLPTAALTALSGRDFMGQEADIGTVTGNFLPLTAQQFFRREGEPPVTAKELATSFLGLNAYPESTRNQFIREREDAAQKQYGKSFEELRLNDQVRITRELNAREPFNVKVPASAKQIQQAFENSVQRVKRITEALPESVQKSLVDSGLHVTGYEPSITIGRDKLLLTDKQQERYEQLLIEEYSKRLPQVKFQQMQRLNIEQRQKLLNRILDPAKDRARARLLTELRKK